MAPSEGRKDDQGKPRLGLLPTDALREIAKVLTFGAAKYSARNWEQGISYERVFSALLRHLFAWWEREEHDPETGLSHLAHAGCCLLFLLSYRTRGMREFDDRPTLRQHSADEFWEHVLQALDSGPLVTPSATTDPPVDGGCDPSGR